MGTLPLDEYHGADVDLSSTGNALLGGYTLMMAVITTLANLLLIKVLIKDLSPHSNVFTKLFLGMITADTLEMTVVALPFSVNQWQGAHDMMGPAVCSVTGAVHFVCDKGSVLLLLVLGVVRLRAMRVARPPGQKDAFGNLLFKVGAGVVITLILLSGVPVVTGESKYRYSYIYFICEWCGDDSPNSHSLTWFIGSVLPHLVMSAGIAAVSWRAIGYVSDPDACKPQVFIRAIKGEASSADCSRVETPVVSKRAPKSPNPSRANRSAPHCARSRSPTTLQDATKPNSPLLTLRVPDSTQTLEPGSASPDSARPPKSPKSLQAARKPNSPLRTVRSPKPPSKRCAQPSAQVVKSADSTLTTPKFRIRIYDTDIMSDVLDGRTCPENNREPPATRACESPARGKREIILGHLPARETSSGDTESLKVTLDVQDMEEELEGSKSITMLLVTYTLLNLPRWITLVLEFLLRVGFKMTASNLLILSCTSLSTFMRCTLTSAVMWWRIISIRNIMMEDK